MIADTRKTYVIFTLIFVEFIAALVMAMIASLPGLDPEMIAILISAAALLLTLTIFEIVVYIRHHIKREAEPTPIKYNPPV
jgi:uncharacterized membrane protein YcaP (DUF421 family)